MATVIPPQTCIEPSADTNKPAPRPQPALYPLFPFVVLGWILGRYGKATILGSAGPYVIAFLGLVFSVVGCLLGARSLASPAHSVLSPWLAYPLGGVVALILYLGLARGALFVADGLNFNDVMARHLSEPLKTKRIVTAPLIGGVIGMIFYAIMKMLMPHGQ